MYLINLKQALPKTMLQKIKIIGLMHQLNYCITNLKIMTMQHNYEYDCFIYHNLWPRTIKIRVHTYNTRNVINLINSIICPNQNT